MSLDLNLDLDFYLKKTLTYTQSLRTEEDPILPSTKHLQYTESDTRSLCKEVLEDHHQLDIQ